MDDDDSASAVAMRMRIFLGGTTVRGPTRVAHAIGPVERFLAQGLFEVAQFSLGASNFEVMVLIDDSDACGVITTIFKLAKAVDD
jgi:hypothetical protein